MITIGTGLGSALFMDGELVPNTELGHLYLKGMDKIAEKFAAASSKKKDDLNWEEWAERFNIYLKMINRLFSPDLVILGGGGSKKYEKYEEHLIDDVRIKPAEMLNNAGIIGAAIYAYKKHQ